MMLWNSSIRRRFSAARCGPTIHVVIRSEKTRMTQRRGATSRTQTLKGRATKSALMRLGSETAIVFGVTSLCLGYTPGTGSLLTEDFVLGAKKILRMEPLPRG